MALPYTVDLSGSVSYTPLNDDGSQYHIAGRWSGQFPTDRLIGPAGENTPDNVTVLLDVSGGTFSSELLQLDFDQVFQYNLSAELAAARLLIQDASGATTWLSVIPGDVDPTDPYVLSTDAAVMLAIARSGARTVRLRFESPSVDRPIAPSFGAGTIAGGAITGARPDWSGARGLSPVFPAGTVAGGAITGAALTHGEAPEDIPLAPAFPAGTVAGGAITGAQATKRIPVHYTLAPVFPAGTIRRARQNQFRSGAQPVRSRHPRIAPVFPAGTVAGGAITGAAPAHGEAPEDIPLAPAFPAGTVAGGAITGAALAHGEAPEDIPLAPAFPAGTVAGGAITGAGITAFLLPEDIPLAPPFRRGVITGRAITGAALEMFDADAHLQTTFAQAEIANAPRRPILTALELRHPTAASPRRMVNDARAWTIGGARFEASRFEAKLIDDAKHKAPQAEIRIANTGRDLAQWIESVGGGTGATVRVLQALSGGADLSVEWELTLDVVGVSIRTNLVHVRLGFDPLLGRPAVETRYDPQSAPGLF